VTRFGIVRREDTATLNLLAIDSFGNYQIDALFPVVVPREGEYFALGLVNSSFGTPELLESTTIGITRRTGLLIVQTNDASGSVLAEEIVDLTGAASVFLRLEISDARNEVVASYSLDTGATWKRADAWTSFVRHGTIYNTATRSALPFVQAGRRLYCGNGVCEALAGENPLTCRADCRSGIGEN
jgi:hypothetical protein